MSEIMVTAAQLRAKAEELENLNQQLKSQNEKLGTTEEALNVMWEGDANTAFHAAFNSDRVQINNFYNAIAAYVSALRVIAQKYEQTEAQNQQIASARNY